MSFRNKIIQQLASANFTFDTNVVWGGSTNGAGYNTLPDTPVLDEIFYGTAEGVDAYSQNCFPIIHDGKIIVQWIHNKTNEGDYGQQIAASERDINGGYWSPLRLVTPRFSEDGDARKLIASPSRPIVYNNKVYYLGFVREKTSGATYLNPAYGIIAVERIDGITLGTPFWVDSPNGLVPTPNSGKPSYAFNGSISEGILAKIKDRTQYTISTYTDTSDPDMATILTDGGGLNFFLELDAVQVKNTYIRISRNNASTSNLSILQRVYFDFGDGIPVISGIPSAPITTSIIRLTDGRICISGSIAGSEPTGSNYRKIIFTAFSDPNTLTFRASNIYKLLDDTLDTGALFSGELKNGVWGCSPMVQIGNKLYYYVSKYKEAIYEVSHIIPSHNLN